VTVPSSPGYFGVIQLCFLTVLKLFVTEEELPGVFAASVYYHLSGYFPVTIGGLLFLGMTGFRMRDMPSAATSANRTSPKDVVDAEALPPKQAVADGRR
jgi:hypothetical protein